MIITNQPIDEIRDAIANEQPEKFSTVGLDFIIDMIESDEDGILPRRTDLIAEVFSEWNNVQDFAESIGRHERHLTWEDFNPDAFHIYAAEDDFLTGFAVVCRLP